MKTTKQMATIITKLAEATGTDLQKPGEHFKIVNPPYMPLCLDVLDKNLVAVAHYYEQNGDLVPDPDMVFFTGYGVENGWVPVSIQQNMGTYTIATELENGQPASFYPRAQADLASFANMWARNIKAQRFLEAVAKEKAAA